jgi:lyso-ornithine lipid O-acyltransferase
MDRAAAWPAKSWKGEHRRGALAVVRLGRFGFLFAALFLLLILPQLLWMAARPRVPSPFARLFLRVLAFAVGLRIDSVGEHPKQSALIVANHISWADILVLGGLARTAFVARADVRNWPVLGFLARLNATIFIDRTARLEVPGQGASIMDGLRRGRVVLFPEGTTDAGKDVLPFRSALFAAAADCAIQPIAISYAPLDGDVAGFAWDGDKTFLAHLIHVVASGGARCRVTVLAPIPPSHGDRKMRAVEARRMIRAALQHGA